MKNKYIILMLCASVIFGCKSRNNSDQDTATSGFVANGDMVTVDETSALAQKLVLETKAAEAADKNM